MKHYRAIVVMTAMWNVFSGAPASAADGKGPLDATVVLPLRYMDGAEIVTEIWLQANQEMKYAFFPGAVTGRVDATEFAGKARVGDLLKRLAPSIAVLPGSTIVLQHDPAAAERIRPLLESANPDDRRLGCYRLGYAGSLAALPLLFGALQDRDESVRHHALRALVRLHDCPEPGFAPGRVSAVGLADAFPESVLVGFLKAANDPSENEWLWAAALLTARPCPGATRELDRGRRHAYPRVAAATRRALDAAKGDAPILAAGEPAHQRDARSAGQWIHRLTARDPHQRATAARVLARRHDVASAPLLAAWNAEADPGVRGEILLALGQKGSQPVWDLILKATGDSHPDLREAAFRALAHCPEPSATERLFEALTGPATPAAERVAAALSLGAAAGPEAIRKLADYVEKHEDPISLAALALSRSGRPDAVPALAACLKKKNDNLKQYAYGGLGRIGTPEAIDAMLKTFDEENNDSRYCAHSALRHVRNPAGIERLIEVGRQGHAPVTCHALEESSDPRAVDMMTQAIAGTNANYRYLGLQALGRIGDPRALPAMLGLLNDADANVRYDAWRALRWRWFWFRPDVRAAFRAHPAFRAFLDDPPAPADQKENTWVCRIWPIDPDDDRVCQTTYEAGVAFDEAAGAMLRWGSHGRRVDVPQLAETWLYRVRDNRWTQGDPALVPAGSCGSVGLSFDRAGRRMVSVQSTGGEHGWQWERERMLRASSPCVYDALADRWWMARPLRSPGCRKAGGQAYVDPAQVHAIFAGWHGYPEAQENVWIYDLFANTWHKIPTVEGQPPLGRIYAGTVYLPGVDRILFTGGRYRKADNRTWFYDLRGNAWSDRQAAGNPPKFLSGVVRDPVTDTVLAFVGNQKGPPSIWQYDAASNAWSQLPPAPEPAPYHEIWDACYDPSNNLFLIHGGLSSWESDSLTVCETWSYKFKAASAVPEGLRAPDALTVSVRKGRAELVWMPVQGAAAYRVYRGNADVPWQIPFTDVAKVPADTTRFLDPLPPATGETNRTYYRVAAVDASGKEGPGSIHVRVQPPVVEEVRVEIRADRTAIVRWTPPAADDVTGYHVYAASLEPPREVKAAEMDKMGPLVRLTEKPLAKTEYADPRPLAATEGVFNHEVRAYVIRAVNTLGIEGGPSPLTWSLPGLVAHARAYPRGDGSVAVKWEALPDPGLRGYSVYRMDELRDVTCRRVNVHPIRNPEFLDWPGPDLAGRRRYYVVGVDALGCEGIPSEGAWAAGRP